MQKELGAGRAWRITAFSLMRRPSLFRRCPGTLDRLARCILRRQVRWQGLAQAWQGQEVERLRKAAQSSMAAQKWRERWQCQAQARQSQEVETLREVPQRSMALAMARSVEPGGAKQQR